MLSCSKKGDRKGQVTVFIILAVLVVAGVVLYFVLNSDSSDSQEVSGQASVESPGSFLESCMEDDIRRSLRELGLRGGGYDPDTSIRYKFVNDTYSRGYQNISYLCYTGSYFNSCDVMDPLFVHNLDSEIKGRLVGEMDSCMDSLRESYEESDYSVSGNSFSGTNFYVDLERNSLAMGVNDTTWELEKAEETNQIGDFSFVYGTKFHNVAMTVNDIVLQEAEYCNFNIQGYTNLYNEFDISKDGAPNGSWIYTVEHENSNDVFRFAVRSCVPNPDL